MLKTAGGVTTEYYHNLAGKVLGEAQGTTVTTGYVYMNDQLVAEYNGGTTNFVHKDHLGSTRVVTDVNGSVVDSMDYLPFGEKTTLAVSPPLGNPGFETGSTDNWTAGYGGATSTVTPSESYTGIYSLAQSGSTTGGSFQDVTGLVNGHSYQVSVWTKSASSTTAQMQLWVHDTAGGNSVSSSASTPGTSWQQVTVTFTADSTLSLRVHLHYVAGSGTIYYDNVQIQDLSASSGATTTVKFTGYERDGETGNDYAMARHYESRLSRFLSPDPLGCDVSNPQSLNRYAYVQNDPLNKIDPSGLCPDPECCDPSDIFSSCSPCDNDPFSCVSPCLFFCSPGGGGDGGGGEPSTPPPPPPGEPLGDPSGVAGQYGIWNESIPGHPPFGGIFFPSNPAGCTYGSGSCGGMIYGFTVGGVTFNSYKDYLNWLRQALLYLKTHPIFISVNEIAAGQLTFQYSTKTICSNVGLGASVPPSKAVTVGVYNNGNMENWTDVLSGWGYSFGANVRPGYAMSTNKSGTIGGPSVSGVGVSGSYTYGACGKLP